MGLAVNTNIQSLFAQRALSRNTGDLQRSMERLSTGFRINRASDDAAGLSISEKMTSQIRGLQKAAQNSSDGISLLQTAEGALGVIQDNLQRIRELMVQGANGTNGPNEIDALQREINTRTTTVNDIATATNFNGQALLKGAANVTLQTGSENGQTTSILLAPGSGNANQGISIDIAFKGGSPAQEGQLSEGATIALNNLRLNNTTVKAVDGVSATGTGTVSDIDVMIVNLSRMRSYLGAMQNSLESKIEYLNVAKENLSASRSRIKDVDIASESSELIKNQILQKSAATMLAQANTSPQIALDLLP